MQGLVNQVITLPAPSTREVFFSTKRNWVGSRGLGRGETLRERGRRGKRGGGSAKGPIEISRAPHPLAEREPRGEVPGFGEEALGWDQGEDGSEDIRGDRDCPVQPRTSLRREMLFLTHMPPNPGLLSAPKGQGRHKTSQSWVSAVPPSHSQGLGSSCRLAPSQDCLGGSREGAVSGKKAKLTQHCPSADLWTQSGRRCHGG